MQSAKRLVQNRCWSAALAVGLVLAVGCAGEPDRAAVYPVTGRVLYKGEPVDGAHVVFRGDAKGKPAVGTTDANGRFQLTTFKKDDGAIAGPHIVTVSKIVSEGGDNAQGKQLSMDQAAAQAAPAATKVSNQLPARYADLNKTDLKFTVKAEGSNDFTIELSD